MAVLTSAIHISQLFLGGYTAILSYSAIIRLQQYESMTKKAATYSATAEQQLHTTRTTQASGALSVLFSLGSSAYLIFAPHSSASVPMSMSLVNCAAGILAYFHISNFWKGSARVPGVADYNTAVRSTEALAKGLIWLSGTWAMAAVCYIWMSSKQEGRS